MRKKGVLTKWTDRGWGIVGVNRVEAFFLHAKNIDEGPLNPAPGMMVEFDAAPPFKDGKLPAAINAVIFEGSQGGAL